MITDIEKNNIIIEYTKIKEIMDTLTDHCNMTAQSPEEERMFIKEASFEIYRKNLI